ncbi:helix-turn-helix domain-containing protein [Lachnospiraceae bacterium C1.1]|nr:AraC family transcriptional regulator [Lachnospiraceae bacterium C1.1]
MNEYVDFTVNFFHKLNLVANIVDISKPLPTDLDLGLRKSIIGPENGYSTKVTFLDPDFIKNRTIYFSIDKYGCHYIFFPLKSEEMNTMLAAGPYLTEPASVIKTNELCKKINIPASLYRYMHQYFSTLPCLQDTSIIENYIDTLAESLFGVGNYQIEYIIQKADADTNYISERESSDNEDIMKRMEHRYELERKIINAISRGDFNSAVRASADPAVRNIDNRSQSTLRSKKNNLLAFNTICRKGAEQGGVHPLFLDDISRRMAVKIENMISPDQDVALHREILKDYCTLVQRNSTSSYSPTMQRALVYIIQHLYDNDLSLQSTAAALSINKSYLSALFKRETKVTFTEYVNSRRIERAIFLLNTTSQPIQEIAGSCGINDVTYFTRIFKQDKGITPSQYRKLITEKV